MDTEKCVPTQHFHIPVLEVESFVPSYRRGVDGEFLVRRIRGGGVGGKLVVSGIGGRKVGQSGDADGRRLDDRGGGIFGNCFGHRGGDRFEWKGRRNLRFGNSIRKTEGRGNGSCSGVALVHPNRSWPPSGEDGWGREALPTNLPQREYLLKEPALARLASSTGRRTYLYQLPSHPAVLTLVAELDTTILVGIFVGGIVSVGLEKFETAVDH